jgi:hypothetical protein
MFGLRSSSRSKVLPAPPADISDARAPAASLTTIPIRGGRLGPKPAATKRELYEGVLEAAAPLPPVAALPAGKQRSAEELVAYWATLCAGRPLPAVLDLDRPRIALGWRNVGLLSYVSDGGATGDPVPRALPLSEQATSADDPLYIPLGGEVVGWVLDLAERTLQLGRPVRDTSRLSEGGIGRLEALLLPFTLRGTPDHVLYHLRRA